MSSLPEVSAEAEHRERMKVLQAEMHAKIAAAREKRDLLIVHTGNGKSQSTAAVGMLARMLGHGRRCAVIQFTKPRDNAVVAFTQMREESDETELKQIIACSGGACEII